MALEAVVKVRRSARNCRLKSNTNARRPVGPDFKSAAIATSEVICLLGRLRSEHSRMLH